uniref:Arminin 622 n=1 Tax=Hydra oligactis TaxID=6088 RepID=R9UFE9_HYDOL|nr:arminin 622 [Hydra oligactis]
MSYFGILFLALIALTYSRSLEDLKEEIKNEVENEIFDDLDDEFEEFDDNIRDAKPFLQHIRWRRLVPYIPVAITVGSMIGKK